jgi:putative tricarboxylic transport membrane protein
MGLYVASLALIGYFMKRHGRYGWALTAAVSIGVPLVAFLVFERWFLVPLPKGPLEAALGF